MNDAGAAVSGTVSPKPAGRGWQAGDRFEMEGAAVAGLSGLCAQRMFKKADRHMFTLGRRARKGPEIVKNSVSRGGFRRSRTSTSASRGSRSSRPAAKMAEWR